MGVLSRRDKIDAWADETLFQRLQRVAFRFPYRPQGVISCSFLEPGFPRGALTEIAGRDGGGKTEAVLRFIAEHDEHYAVWVEPEISLYPPALERFGVDPRRLLFVETGVSALVWSALQALRSGIFSLVLVADGQGVLRWTARQLRLLQLEAERADASVVLLQECATQADSWPIALRLRIQRKRVEGNAGHGCPGLEIPDRTRTPTSDLDCHVLKSKGGITWKSLAT